MGKPRILETKHEIAKLIHEYYKVEGYRMVGFRYWRAKYKIGKWLLFVNVEYYSRGLKKLKRVQIQDVKNSYKPLTITEIKSLNFYIKQKNGI